MTPVYTVTQDALCLICTDGNIILRRRGSPGYDDLRDVLFREAWDEIPRFLSRDDEDEDDDEPEDDPDMPPDDEEEEDEYFEDDESDAEDDEDGTMKAVTSSNQRDKKPKLVRGFIKLSKMTPHQLNQQPIKILRTYAGRGLKITGASKIRGGKRALVQRIVRVRG